jgi:hypothetical protein
MSLSRLFRVSIVALLCAFSVNTAKAQSPDAALGIGVSMTPSLSIAGAGSSVGLFGGTVSYALSPAFHIGTGIGAGVTTFVSEGDTTESITTYLFSPYARLLFMGNETFKPMVQAQLLVGSLQTDQSFMKMTFAVGAEHFVNRNFGIYGNVRIVDFDISNSFTAGGETVDGKKLANFGFMAPTLGIEWFF